MAAYAAIVGFQLLTPPALGLSNNGDFGKTVGFFGVGAPFEDEYKYADLKYRFDPFYRSRPQFRSSETALAAVAIRLNKLFIKDRTFDMRWIGAVHGLISLTTLILLLPLFGEMPVWKRAAWYAALLFVFGDIMYVSYFSSFYMDAAALVFLLLTLVLFLRVAKWRKPAEAAGLILCAVLTVLAKPQHAVLGLWIAAAFVFGGAALWTRSGRGFGVVAATLVAGAAVFSLRSSPREYSAEGCYTVIFYQVLPHSPDAAADLRSLGLDDDDRKWIGTYAFSDHSGMSDPAFAQAFTAKMSYARLGWFFATHPASAFLALKASVSEGARQRPGMGNYDKSAGHEPYAESHAFSFWSDAKKALFYQHPERYLAAYFGLAVLLCAAAAVRKKALGAATVIGAFALAGMAVTALLVASLGDAAEVARHHFIATALFDVMLVATVGVITASPAQTVRGR